MTQQPQVAPQLRRRPHAPNYPMLSARTAARVLILERRIRLLTLLAILNFLGLVLLSLQVAFR